jgi:hypothetical protein
MKKFFFAIMVAIVAMVAMGCQRNDVLKFKTDDSSLSYEIPLDSLSSMILSNDGNAHCWMYDLPDGDTCYSVLIFIDDHPAISKVQFLFEFDDEDCLSPCDCSLELKSLSGEFWIINERDELQKLADAVSPVLYVTLDECLDVNSYPQDEWSEVELSDSD